MNKAMENCTRLSKRDQLDVCPPLHRENSAKKRQVLTGESEMKPEMAIQAIKAKDENRESNGSKASMSIARATVGKQR